MKLPNDGATLCALCNKEAAIKRYVHKKLNEMVCAACFDHWTLQDILQSEFPRIYALERAGRHDEALASLDAILESNRARDHDGYLAQSIASHRVLILLNARRFSEAEHACKAWAQLGFADVSERWMHALGMAHALEGLGRDREAMAALENGLAHEDSKYLPSALGVLAALARISEKLALPVDPKWMRLAEAVAACYEVDMPVKGSPREAILALEEIVGMMQPKRPAE